MVAAVHDGKDLRKKIVFNLKRKSEGATDDLAISLTSKPPQTTTVNIKHPAVCRAAVAMQYIQRRISCARRAEKTYIKQKAS